MEKRKCHFEGRLILELVTNLERSKLSKAVTSVNIFTIINLSTSHHNLSPTNQLKPIMPKEKSVNPAQAERKKEKAKAIKKGTSSLPLPPSLCQTISTNPTLLFLQAKQKTNPAATSASRVKTRTVSKNNSKNSEPSNPPAGN